jgi:indole-3-glycerol phosphate synthase
VTTTASAADLLATIVAATRRIVAVRQSREPMSALARRAERKTTMAARFRAALGGKGGINVIAECKRRSPSKGVLRDDYDAAAIARGYERGGAVAISVLTEPTFFDGSLADLEKVREAVTLPLLRKDFIVSEYQLFEARAAGADAVLLIVAALSPNDLRSLAVRAAELGLAALVEVHSEEELERALEAEARMIGVNNRNLRTLAVDVEASERLIARIPADVVAVSESGLKSAADLVRLRGLGYKAFLIGERFVVEAAPGAALAGLLSACGQASSPGEATREDASA